MALVNLNMNSKYLCGNTEVTIILPDRLQRDEAIAIIKLPAKMMKQSLSRDHMQEIKENGEYAE